MPTTKSSSKTPAKSSAKTPAKAEAKAEAKPAAKPAAGDKSPPRDSKTDVKSASKIAPSAAAAPAKKADGAKADGAKAERPSRTDDGKPGGAVTAREAREAKDQKEGKESSTEPMTLPRMAAAVPAAAQEERVSVTTTMSKAQLARFRKLLEDKRDDIIKKAKETLEEDMTLDTNDLPDEMDLASSEYLQSFTFRLRGREKSFLDKINKALERIDNQTFGVCEECADEISVKRLEARPETTLCIRCKEDQERAEKDYG